MLTFKNETTGQTHEVAVVHHRDHEGSVFVDTTTGVIVTPIMERPDWAEGLAAALLAEHVSWYTQRCGPSYELPEAIEYSDLGWLGIDPESGNEAEIFASDDMRQERLINMLGMIPENGDIKDALSEVEIALDNKRTEGEASAFDDSQAQGFEDLNGRAVNA